MRLVILTPHDPFIPTKVGTQAELAASVRNETPATAWVPTFVGMKGVFGRGVPA
jgi:hypothetical protein